MYAKGIRDIQVEMLVKGKWNPGSLTNMWNLPARGQNLFSSGAALYKGLIEFADNKQREFRNKNSDTVAVGIRTGPTPDAGKSPYEIWFKRKPSVDHLKIFGTECFIHIPKQKRRKFDKKAIKGYFVSYCGEKDGYCIWVLDKNDVLSRDVVFKDEIMSEKTSIEIVQSQQKKPEKNM
ncbi:hypothetical protein AVEN_16172-1 [Araneus ventricosus]|uniref:Retroviral polymerase SH3-like domain-containing protein n=1 Tax=Araneus ventricosus TaxID=182803 RepID=A0A4Y2TNL0_ARAVE|nr:hypothetical protein AVEN_16172-1 [Araneus ventricosus]